MEGADLDNSGAHETVLGCMSFALLLRVLEAVREQTHVLSISCSVAGSAIEDAEQGRQHEYRGRYPSDKPSRCVKRKRSKRYEEHIVGDAVL